MIAEEAISKENGRLPIRGGIWHKCSQIIHIGSGGVFDENDIYWPHDYITEDCNESTDPDDLPHPHDYPEIHEEECAMIFWSYKDWVFTQQGGGPCKKILRKWKVIDWCVYDPNDHYTQGIWTHTQVIKILNSSPPELWCPDDLTVNTNQGCAAWVDIPEVEIGGECSEYTQVSNNSPYAFDNGPDASGNYPVGTTQVCFFADDGCGNEAECCMYVTVEDGKKPTPVCYSGIVITLGVQYDGYYRVCPWYIIDKGSYDNCTAEEDLIIWLEPDTFTCEDVGLAEVTMYVQDESGNVNFCETFIYVQDNMEMCPPPDSLTINGNVHTFKHDMVDNVLIKNMMTSEEVMTLEDGMFTMGNLLAEEDYMISAYKDSEPLDGVTMEDLATLSEHLFGQNEFDNGFLYIASDVNNNEKVNLEDFILLRDLIIGEYDDFDDFSDQTSWRFVRDGYEFDDFKNPWGWEADMMFYELPGSQHNRNFVGVKIGDINEDLFENGVTNDEISEFRSSIAVNGEEQSLESGAEFTTQLTIPLTSEMLGVDMIIHVEGMRIDDVQLNNEDLVYKLSNKELRILGVNTTGIWSDVNLTLTGVAQADNFISELVSLEKGNILYKNRTGSQMNLRFKGQAAAGLEIIGSLPNPFSESTTLSFNLPETGAYSLRISNAQGKTVLGTDQLGNKGKNTVVIEGDQLGSSGVYLASIRFGDEVQTVRLISISE